MIKFLSENWQPLVAFLFGGGVVWGTLKIQLQQLFSNDKEQSEKISELEIQLTEHMLTCPAKIHEKLNRVAEDVSFIKGFLTKE